MGKVYIDDVEVGMFDPQTVSATGTVYIDDVEIGTFSFSTPTGYAYIDTVIVGTYTVAGAPIVKPVLDWLGMAETVEVEKVVGIMKEVSDAMGLFDFPYAVRYPITVKQVSDSVGMADTVYKMVASAPKWVGVFQPSAFAPLAYKVIIIQRSGE